jgi:PLP dependent protein
MIGHNLEQIQKRIDARCNLVGRSPSEITLLAVTKTFPAERVAEVVRFGLLDIGENYVQELLGKKSELNDERIRWHFIGHLQSNKVKYIVDWVHLIHAVESTELAKEIDRRAGQVKRIVDVLLEVNTTGELSKFGLIPERTVEFVRRHEHLQNIRITGLMTIGPFLPDPEGSRPMFRQLRSLKEQIANLHQSNVSMKHLSMGMSGDFEVAIEEGATILRIGTAILGSRKKAN